MHSQYKVCFISSVTERRTYSHNEWALLREIRRIMTSSLHSPTGLLFKTGLLSPQFAEEKMFWTGWTVSMMAYPPATPQARQGKADPRAKHKSPPRSVTITAGTQCLSGDQSQLEDRMAWLGIERDSYLQSLGTQQQKSKDGIDSQPLLVMMSLLLLLGPVRKKEGELIQELASHTIFKPDSASRGKRSDEWSNPPLTRAMLLCQYDWMTSRNLKDSYLPPSSTTPFSTYF